MKWSIITAVSIAVFGFIPGMGIPGAIVLSIGELGAQLFGKSLLCLQGDRAWPAAIMATWIWPVFIPAGFWVSFRLVKDRPAAVRWIVFALILLAGAMLVTLALEQMARAESA